MKKRRENGMRKVDLWWWLDDDELGIEDMEVRKNKF
jgi:hypothetical protein